jgi:tripartite-type tricarboxylate transporter receptor subunit TctC
MQRMHSKFPTNSRYQLTRRDSLGVIGAASIGLTTSSLVSAQSQTMRIVVGYPAGGASDRAARIVADRLKDVLAVNVAVENRPGAGGRLAAQQFKNIKADEQVLMMGNPAVSVFAPLVFNNLGYDPAKDFVPVAYVNDTDFALAVGPAAPVREVSHLLAWARANASQANIGIPAAGSLPHFVSVLMGFLANQPLNVVPYNGSAPLVTNLLGGQIPMAVDTLDTYLPHHESGKLRILAQSSKARSSFAPNIPSFRESGLPFTASGFGLLFASSSMPSAQVKRIGDAIAKIMNEPETKKKFIDSKMTPVSANAEQSKKLLQDFRTTWEPVIKRSGFKATS